jgi:hypothetical protein
MGDFLHLPEIDPAFVYELDTDIVSTCITKYMECVISTLNLSSMDKAVAKFSGRTDAEKMTFFQNKLEQLKKYIMLLLGRLPEDVKKAEGEWIRLEKDYQALKSADKDVSWRKIQNYLSYLLPSPSIDWIKILYEKLVLEKLAVEMTIDAHVELIMRVYDVLQRLTVLEGVIKKKQEIQNAYFSVKMNDIIVGFNSSQCALTDLIRTLLSSPTILSITIPLNDLVAFHSSLQQRIAKISLFYGLDWKTRVNSLIERLKESKRNVPFDERSPIHFFSIVMLAAMLSNSELYFPDALLNAWDSARLRIFERLKGLWFQANNNEIKFCNSRNSYESQQLYSIDLDDFNENEQNRLDRMMLADAILKTHPFKV